MEALQDEKTLNEDEVCFNFINSLKSEITKETSNVQKPYNRSWRNAK